ncbi:MAG: hypothetical protein ACKOQ3_05960 [Novosphingobium sp.]
MQVRLDDPGEYDRYENEFRFIAKVNGESTSVTATGAALFLVTEALGMVPSTPQAAYAAGGSLLKKVIAEVIKITGDLQPTYLITHTDVLRVTGSVNGMPHVPKRWKPY